MKLCWRKASAQEPFWWNWDKQRRARNIRLLSLEYVLAANEKAAGFVLTIWSWQVALTWWRKEKGRDE